MRKILLLIAFWIPTTSLIYSQTTQPMNGSFSVTKNFTINGKTYLKTLSSATTDTNQYKVLYVDPINGELRKRGLPTVSISTCVKYPDTLTRIATKYDLENLVFGTTKDSLVNATNYLINSGNGSGFTNNENITVTYSEANRTITLSGTYKMYWKGKVIQDMTAGSWVSSAHSLSPTQPLFLKYNASGYSWSSTPWTFDEVQIAYVGFDGTGFKGAFREVHGLMDAESHKEAHNTIGTYKLANGGGDLGSYTISSTTAGDRRPTVSQCRINDEDLPTLIPAISDDKYTRFHLTSTGTSNFTQNSNDIDSLNGNIPFYNQFTGGNWIQTAFPVTNYGAIFLYASPSTADYKSHKRRFFWVQPQQVSGTLSTIQSVGTSSINLGDFTNFATEFVPIAKVIIRYNAGNWTIISVENIVTNKVASGIVGSVGLTTVTTDGTTITGSGIVGDPLIATGDFSGSNVTVGTVGVNKTATINGSVLANEYKFNNVLGNTIIGNEIPLLSTSNNTVVGFQSLASHATSNNNTCFGYRSGYNQTTGSYNVYIGHDQRGIAGENNKLYIGNTAFALPLIGGDFGLYRVDINGSLNVTGSITSTNINANSNSTIIGAGAGGNGLYNTVYGVSSGTNLTAGDNNLFGYSNGRLLTSAQQNVSMGDFTFYSATTGSYNTIIGTSAMRVGNGSGNTFLGQEVGFNATGSYNVFLGYQAGYSETGSNLLYLHNSATTTPLIWGNFATSKVIINGSLRALKEVEINASTSDKTLTASDNGEVYDCTQSGAVKFIIPNDLPVGFQFDVIADSNNQISFYETGGVLTGNYLKNDLGLYKTRAQYSHVHIIVVRTGQTGLVILSGGVGN